MPDIQSPFPIARHLRSRSLAMGVVLAALLMLIGTAHSIAADAPIAGHPRMVAAQATNPVGQNPGPRLQPVGNGDTIASPVDTTDDSGSRDSSWWWRVIFGAAVVVVVLVALVQRRGTPDPARRTGSRSGPGRSGNDRNVLGH